MRRGISGTTLLVALVPPSQPTISMGARQASQPVRKVKAGRMGPMAAIMRIMNERSPEESLMPMTRGKSAARRRMVGTSMGEANIGMLYRVMSMGTRIYWYDQAGQAIMESMQGGRGFLNEYLYVGGQRVARVANLGPIYYYYGDHLGTARLITDGGEPSATRSEE